ncbi:hypothetical protein ACOSP7_001972 [Xanthoceras sorbifolium]
MGSCVSSVHSYGSKNDSLVIPPSPIKEKPVNGDPPINGWSATTFKDPGSKEETFFDSRAWLDSDCEDDFFSVRGDFTPSRGNTPVHQSFPAGTSTHGNTLVHQSFPSGTPQANKTLMEDITPGSIPEPPPTRKKMKLSELFRQSTQEDPEDQQVDEQHTVGSQNTANGKVEVKTTILDVLPSENGTPYISGTNSMASSERTANGDSLMDKEKKPMRSVHCCLPSLVSRNFNERKKKMSPALAVNG